MKKRRAALCLLLAASLALAGCGKKSAPVETPAPDYSINAAEATPAVSAAPKISEKYNSIDDTARAEKNAVRDELLSVADGCRDIYEQADKGTAINVVLSTATVQAMVTRIGQMGYSAVDYLGTMDMQCPDPIIYFGSTISAAGDTGVSYYMVYNDGQISVYHLGRVYGIVRRGRFDRG